MNEAKDIPLNDADLSILIEAMKGHHARTIRKFQRAKQPRTVEQTVQLGAQQRLLQYLTRKQYEWQTEEF